MSEDSKVPTKPTVPVAPQAATVAPVTAKKEEKRIDPFAVEAFGRLGYSIPLPDSVVAAYLDVKRRKDVLQPGRMSPEGFALVALLADLNDGTFSFKKD
jgi:hypothetical protein